MRFEKKGGVLYRLYKNLAANNGETLRQVLVPKIFCHKVMELAHCSMMGGYLGTKKTLDRIKNFYWLGTSRDLSRFCRSCDIWQKMIAREMLQKCH